VVTPRAAGERSQAGSAEDDDQARAVPPALVRAPVAAPRAAYFSRLVATGTASDAPDDREFESTPDPSPATAFLRPAYLGKDIFVM
jgi:hypothetical protein